MYRLKIDSKWNKNAKSAYRYVNLSRELVFFSKRKTQRNFFLSENNYAAARYSLDYMCAPISRLGVYQSTNQIDYTDL